MFFNTFYKFLKLQLFSPTIRSRCRVWLVKDQRLYRIGYVKIIYQLLGGRWLPLVQPISTDGLILKRFGRYIFFFFLFLLGLYVFF